MLLFVYACGGPQIVHSDEMAIGEQWSYDDVLVSSFDVQDTIQKYDLALRVNHTLDYDYQNIYLQIETIFPDGNKASNPLSLDLADKIGTWLGKCGGDGCEITFSFQDDFRFQSLGKHQFTIGQFSRENQLAGISEIELILFKAGED